jgi:hypothetical protein
MVFAIEASGSPRHDDNFFPTSKNAIGPRIEPEIGIGIHHRLRNRAANFDRSDK